MLELYKVEFEVLELRHDEDDVEDAQKDGIDITNKEALAEWLMDNDRCQLKGAGWNELGNTLAGWEEVEKEMGRLGLVWDCPFPAIT
jgi:hypothetical protein